jgi:hypothetical protein
MIISAAGGSPSSVSTSFNVHLSGSHITGSSNTPGNSSRGTSAVQISYYVNDAALGGGSQSVSNHDSVEEPPFESGDLVGFDGNAVITGRGTTSGEAFSISPGSGTSWATARMCAVRVRDVASAVLPSDSPFRSGMTWQSRTGRSRDGERSVAASDRAHMSGIGLHVGVRR